MKRLVDYTVGELLEGGGAIVFSREELRRYRMPTPVKPTPPAK